MNSSVPSRKYSVRVQQLRSRKNNKRVNKVLNTSSQKKKKRIYSLIVRVFLLIFLSGTVIFTTFFVFVQFQSTWSEQEPLHILLVQKKTDDSVLHGLTLLSINQQDSQVLVYPLEGSTQLNALGGFGQFQLAALYQLYAMEKKSDFIYALLAYQYGVLAKEKIVYSSDQPVESYEQLLQFFSPLAQLQFRSSLPLIDRYHVWLVLKRMNKKKLVILQPGSAGTQYAQEASTQFSNFQVKKSAPTIAIVNATSISGFASRVAQVLENYGFAVIRVSSDKSNEQINSKIILSSDQVVSPQVLKLLTVFFPTSASTLIDPDVTVLYRSDIVLYLGKDLENVYE